MEAVLSLNSACPRSLALHFMHLHLRPGEQDDVGHDLCDELKQMPLLRRRTKTLISAWQRTDPPECLCARR